MSFIIFTKVADFQVHSSNNNKTIAKKNYEESFTKLKARYIKVHAKNIEVCPDWHVGAGKKAWLFVDEIVVE